jgi:DNA-binding NtrC family response regulator
MKTAKYAPPSSPGLATMGTSQIAQTVRAESEKLSQNSDCVLIVGPSGSGKESLARGIHAASSRHEKPFVTLNSKLLSAGGMFDSQVFGHLPGAFAGLKSSSLGLIQAAHGGTLFISEVESLELESQWKLLRTLQDQQVVPLGGSEGIPVDVRVIASTCINLPLGISVGLFRADLFQMLSANLVEMHRLADRQEDLPVLAEKIVGEVTARRKLPAKRFSDAALQWMTRYEWPGNLPELRKAIDLATTIETEVIDERTLRLALKKVHAPASAFTLAPASATGTRFQGFAAMRANLGSRCQ